MKGRVAGLTALAVVAAGGTLTAQELWPAPGRTAAAAGGRVTAVSIPAAGLAAVPVCPGPQSLVAPVGGEATGPGGPVVVGAAVGETRSPGSPGGGRPTLAGLALHDGGEGVAVRTSARTAAGPVTLQVPRFSEVPAMSVVQVTLSRTGDARGLAALVCPTTATQTWLVGGGTQPGRRGQLVLANPAATPAAADVTVYGPKGPVQAPAGAGVTVPARGVRALRVDALAPGLDAVAVLVRARSGRVSATLQDSWIRGLTPSGSDDVTAAAPPSRRQVVPGVSVAPAPGAHLPQAPDDPGAVAVRVVNPGTGDAVTRVRLLGPSGAVDLPGGVLTLGAGEVRDVAVTQVPSGVYSAVVEADVPVVAGAVTGRVPSAPVGRPSDLGWAASVEPLAASALLAVPEITENGARVTTGRVLAVVAPDGAGSLEVVELDGGGRRLAAARAEVRGGATSRFNVSTAAAAVLLRPLAGSAPLMAAVTLHVSDASGPMISVLPVRSTAAGPDPRPYAVSDVRVGLR